MSSRITFIGLVGAIMISNVSFASPHVQVNPNTIAADFNYTISKNNEAYHEVGWYAERTVNGHAQEYTITYGLKNGYAVSIGMNNYRFDQFDDGINQTTPSLDTLDIRAQKQITESIALFTGIKHVTGSWTYSSSSYIPPAISKDNWSQNIAELGVIAEASLSNQVRAYATAGVGHDLREYKVGLSYNNVFEVGYRNIKYQNLYNPLFASAGPPINGLDLTAKGLYFGVEYKF